MRRLHNPEDFVRELAAEILPPLYERGEVEDGHLLRAIEKALQKRLRRPEFELYKRDSFTLRLMQDMRNWFQYEMMVQDPNAPLWHPTCFHKDAALFFDRREKRVRKQIGEGEIDQRHDEKGIQLLEQGSRQFRSAKQLKRMAKSRLELAYAELEAIEEMSEDFRQRAA